MRLSARRGKQRESARVRLAQRYARGQAVLYGETREYVKRVLARLNDAR